MKRKKEKCANIQSHYATWPYPYFILYFPLPNIIIAEAEKIIGKKEETKKKREVKNDFPFLR